MREMDLVPLPYQLNHPILTPEREAELLGKVLCCPLPGYEEVVNRGKVVATEELVKCNQRFIYNQALRVYRFSVAQGLDKVDLDDLMQEGNIALLKAIKKFDPSKGERLLTYASSIIKTYTSRSAQEQNNTISIPTNQIESAEKRAKLVEIAQVTHSLDQPVNQTGQTPLDLEATRGDFTEGVDHLQVLSSLGDKLREALETKLQQARELTPKTAAKQIRNINILREYFGFDLDSCPTMEELAEKYNLTRVTVSQIIHSMLPKLKSFPEISNLRPYLQALDL
jgi:RNA polymerase primary sigma factor